MASLNVEGAVEGLGHPIRLVILGTYSMISSAMGILMAHQTGRAFFGESSYDVAVNDLRAAADDGELDTRDMFRVASALPYKVPPAQWAAEFIAHAAGLGLGTILLSEVIRDTAP